MLITDNPVFGPMIAHAAGVGFDPARDRVLSRIEGRELLGGVVFTNYNGRSITMHMAGQPGWVNLRLIWLVFDYAFMQLGVEKVLGVVDSTQEKVLDYDRRLGFKEVARIPGAIPDGDIVVLSMSREECKWLALRSRYLKENGHAEFKPWEARPVL